MAAPNRPGQQTEGPPTLYLIFAGLHGETRRGTGDLVAVAASPDEARQAFRAVRLQLRDRDGWAELTAISEGGKARRLSWFGVDRWPRPNPLAAMPVGPADQVNIRGRRRRRVA
jgi:hypothetical protein